MGEGFIVRTFGGSLQTLAPDILDFSATSTTTIKFKLKNNDTLSATLVYRFGTMTGDGQSIFVLGGETTDEITLTVPEFLFDTPLFVTANAQGKVKSEITEQIITTFATFTEATGGTTFEYDLDGKRYRSHTFTENGTFEVTAAGNDDRNLVDYLIIAGGGGGNRDFSNSAGGAGGYRTTHGLSGGSSSPENKVAVTETSYSVTIGSGGPGGTSSTVNVGNARDGSPSSIAFASTISTVGGGGAGTGSSTTGQGRPGGSGGGGGQSQINLNGGAGTSNQGTNGFRGRIGGNVIGGGGGGAGTGATNVTDVNQNGGNGLPNILRIGTEEIRAGGGGASESSFNIGPGLGGDGGGGDGVLGGGSVGGNGVQFTGSGGGGARGVGGNGGDGIVVIRYEILPSA